MDLSKLLQLSRLLLLSLAISLFSSVQAQVVHVACGSTHTCAILTDSTVKCWGAGQSGKLGYNDRDNRGDESGEMGAHLPVVDLGSGRSAVELSLGNQHTCARLDNGQIKCWGQGGSGQLGYGDRHDRGDFGLEMGNNLHFVDLGSGRTALQVYAGIQHTCVVLNDRNAKCFGLGLNGRLGNGDTQREGDESGEMGDNLQPINFGSGRRVLHIVAGYSHTCALLTDRTVRCWGSGSTLGYEDNLSRGGSSGDMGNNLKPVNLGSGRTVLQLTSGDYHNCAILDDLTVKCWGEGRLGQLGNGDTGNYYVGDESQEMGSRLPVVDLGTGRHAVQIDAGGSHTCALLDDDTVKCWGLGAGGRLGYGNGWSIGDQGGEMGDSLLPVDLGTGRTAVFIACGGGHSCAILDDATLKCWGGSTDGQLGQNDRTNLGDHGNEMGDRLPIVDLGITSEPTASPSLFPTNSPTISPTEAPTTTPTPNPTLSPVPTSSPSLYPTVSPSTSPSQAPSTTPTTSPTNSPSSSPSSSPTTSPSFFPSKSPTTSPSLSPSPTPSTSGPSQSPSQAPSSSPTSNPSNSPSTLSPSVSPTIDPGDIGQDDAILIGAIVGAIVLAVLAAACRYAWSKKSGSSLQTEQDPTCEDDNNTNGALLI